MLESSLVGRQTIPRRPPARAFERLRFRSWRAAVDHLERTLPATVVLLSVDVFDTLVFRRIHPDLIVTGTARELERRLRRCGFPPARDAASCRGLAHDEVAARCQAAGGDCEAPLRETLRHWIELVAGTSVPGADTIACALEAFEVDHELEAARPNGILVEWLTRERGRGRRIVFCSDMYLGQLHLVRILERAGCAHLFDGGYVSSDAGLTKISGRLFANLLDGESVRPEQVVHIGDSLEADGRGPARAGIRGIIVRDRESLKRSAIARANRDNYQQDTCWAGAVVADYADADAAPASVEETLGYSVVGPILAATSHRIAELCRTSRVRHVYFLAREGLLLKVGFDLLRSHVWLDEPAPPSSYLCISRVTTLAAAARGLGLHELSAALTNHPFPTVRRVLSPFTIPEEVMRRSAARCGIPDIDARLPESFRDWPPFLRLVECRDLLGHVQQTSSRMRDMLGRYLTQERFFEGGRVALVDVGWGGLMQDNLRRAFGSRPGYPEVVGLYAGVDAFGRDRRAGGSTFVGVLGESQASGWQSGSLFLCPPGFEALLRAPHGTTIGYKAGDTGPVTPVLRDDPDRGPEPADDPGLALVQAASVRYASRYAECARLMHATADQTIGYARTCLDRFMRYPSVAEARYLLSLSSVADLGTRESRRIGADVSRLPYVTRMRQLRPLLRSSAWPHGTIVLATGETFRHLFVTWWALKACLPCHPEPDPASRRTSAGAVPTPKDPDEQTPSTAQPTVERLAYERIAQLSSVAAGSPRPTDNVPGILDLRYSLLAPIERRLVSGLRRLRGKQPYTSDGVSHAMLLKRAFARSTVGREMVNASIWLFTRRWRLHPPRSERER